MRNKIKAFTLIELLVVIAIIGILATISVLVLSNARAKARDVKRVENVRQIQVALELFFNDNNRYPTEAEWDTGQISSDLSIYLLSIPEAPLPDDGSCSNSANRFVYRQRENGLSYSLSFCLGGSTGALNPGDKCAKPHEVGDGDCFVCGDQIELSDILGHTCNTGAPDYDLCAYNTVQVGTQCWIKENINIGTMTNGSLSQTDNGVLEKYCYSNNYTNCQLYGALYQWNETMQYSTVESSQGVCPSGWHIPSDNDLNVLTAYLGGAGVTSGIMKSKSTDTPPWNGTNLYGFSVAPAGCRHSSAYFTQMGNLTFLWTSSYDTGNTANAFDRHFITANSYLYRFSHSKNYGFLVKCMKD